MIDMHNHILFGVDDGAKTIDDSIKLINEEIKKGVSHIILTPHYNKNCVNCDENSIENNFKVLNGYVIKEGLPVKLHLGNEVYFDSNFYETLDKENFKTLASSDYLLIEFSLIDMPDNIAEMCYETRLKGYIPIIAHIERYTDLYNNLEMFREILNEGALLQVNASSIVGMESKGINKFVNYLLKHELISFAASDAHNMDSRGFYLDEAYKIVKKSHGDAYADRIFKINQQKILLNEYFDTPVLKSSGGRILSKLFRNK